MRAFLLIVLIFIFSTPALAYVTVEPDFAQLEQYEPYEVTSDFYTRTLYLGELTRDAQLYEITVDVADTLPITLYQRVSRKPQPLGLLVVEVLGDGEGVREVARQNISPDQWTRHKDPALGITTLRNETLEVALTPATYLVEVSTPRNEGTYALALGVDDARPGYFKELGAVRDIQSHFGYSFFRMLASSLVYWPLGIFLLAYGLYRLYKFHMDL